MSSEDRKSPPKARFVIRVGITGHRTNGLDKADPDQLKSAICGVLNNIKSTVSGLVDDARDLYSTEAPELRIVSPIADGADSITAVAGLEAGYKLNCILPFRRREYEKDFPTKESAEVFRDLLQGADAVFELDGSRGTRNSEEDAYLEVGRMVLKQSDVIIAVWDGEDAKGRGGTGQIVKEAILSDIPVVWIESFSPHTVRVITSDDSGGQREMDMDYLRNLLLRIINPDLSSETEINNTYFSETQPSWTWGIIYEIFCDLFSGERIETSGVKITNFEEQTKSEWERIWSAVPGLPESVIKQMNDKFLLHYSWADKLANYYSNIYRSSFVANYLMAGLAVLFALLSVTIPALGVLWISCEFVFVSLILLNTTLGNRKHWHERWIDYRLLSEQLRQLSFLAPLGLTTPAFRVPAHDTHGDPRNSWVNRHFRAIVRDAGIINASIDSSYLKAFSVLLSDQEIAAQISYHKHNSPRLHKIHHRLHQLGSTLFFLTFVAVFTHFFVHSGWLILVAAVFPALGAAFYGIRTQGEFEQIAKRSYAMAMNLENIKQGIGREADEVTYRRLGIAAEKTADIMSSEILDWRIFFQSKRLVLPV